MQAFQKQLAKKHSGSANLRQAAMLNFVGRHDISYQNYFRQTAKSGEDILNHSRAITNGIFSVRRFWSWTLIVISQTLRVTFGADVEHSCMPNGTSTFREIIKNVQKERTNKRTN